MGYFLCEVVVLFELISRKVLFCDVDFTQAVVEMRAEGLSEEGVEVVGGRGPDGPDPM